WAPIPPPHAAARPLNLPWAPSTASSCCCRSESPWGPVRPPIAAVCLAMCHFQVFLTLLVCSIFCHRVLADYGPPIAAARPLICHGPLYRPPPHAAARSRVSLMVHVPLSGLLTLLVCYFRL
ncbi:unnamed protein product, partial [Staurois parvus]